MCPTLLWQAGIGLTLIAVGRLCFSSKSEKDPGDFGLFSLASHL